MPNEKIKNKIKYNVSRIRANLEHFNDCLNFFTIMYEVPIFFALFPGKFFDSPGISEMLLIYTRLCNTGF